MGFIKNAIIGIAIFEGIKYLTKKDILGTSNFDRLKEQVPELIEKAKDAVSGSESGALPRI